MADNSNPLPPIPSSQHLPSEFPPAYSKTPPPVVQSLSSSCSGPSSHQRFLPGDSEELYPPLFSCNTPLPPSYSAFDETINSFALSAPIIHTTSTSGTLRPRHQLSEECSKSGKPWRLRIRRLLPTESRRLSIPSSSSKSRLVEYDDDTTLYLIEDTGALNPFKGQCVEIRGRRANTLPGHIKLRNASDNKSCKFWHVTRNSANDSLKKENERKMQKYGYRADDEWDKKLLFSTSMRLRQGGKIDWRDGQGDIIAAEQSDTFRIVKEVDQVTRDALVTCWVARRWAAGSLSWTANGSHNLARAVTLN